MRQSRQNVSHTEVKTKRRPARNAEERENEMIGFAVDLAEKQLREGTASAQVITHYLKLGSRKERLEREAMEAQIELLNAKVEALKSQQHTEELYAAALKAMRRYSGDRTADDL